MRIATNFFLNQISKAAVKEKKLFNRVSSWVTSVGNSENIDNKRFIVCAAIDLKAKLLDADDFINVIKKLNFDIDNFNFIHEFDIAVHKYLDQLFLHSKICDSSYPTEKYCVLIYWSKIFSKFKETAKTLCRGKAMPRSRTEEDKIYNDFFFEKTKTLNDINNWAGWKQLVWVLPSADLQSDLMSEVDRVNSIINRAGLNPPNPTPSNLFEFDKLFYIEYPDSLSIRCYQPTTLCGCWINSDGLYVSYLNKDGYGRTVATNGKYDPKDEDRSISRERVHSWEPLNHKDFKLVEIGFPDGSLNKAPSKMILDIAVNRFSKC